MIKVPESKKDLTFELTLPLGLCSGVVVGLIIEPVGLVYGIAGGLLLGVVAPVLLGNSAIRESEKSENSEK